MRFVLCVIFGGNLLAFVYANVKNGMTNYEDRNKPSNYLDVTLIGANGDLSKKYLWNGLFDLFNKYAYQNLGGKEKQWSFSFYGAGRDNSSVGGSLLKYNIKKYVLCSNVDQNCIQAKNVYAKQIKYVQLKTDADYANHCNKLLENQRDKFCYKGQDCLYQHIIYLSIPPFAYEQTTQRISLFCQQNHQENVVKVVLEKPFGHDEKSAISQAKSISQYLSDENIYRVDHYLGKQTVEQIQPFLQTNTHIHNMMNFNFVDRIEIVLKEKLDVKGRAEYYDKYGVMCDVMQNHLFEIMCLLTMDTFNIKNFTLAKNQLISQIQPIKKRNIVIGQYKGYQEEVQSEAKNNVTTRTPTFASVKMEINSSSWKNVPIFIVSGKKLNERVGFVRIAFKDIYFNMVRKECSSSHEIIFHIGQGILNCPAILISKLLPMNSNYVPAGWKQTHKFDDLILFNIPIKCFVVFIPINNKDAYTVLIEKVFLGQKKQFVAEDTLLESWKIWGTIIKETKDTHPLIYGSPEELDFVYINDTLKYQNKYLKHLNKLFLGQNLITGSCDEVIYQLAEDIREAAINSIRQQTFFNIAFSGGTSPLKLFKYFRDHMKTSFPWKQTNIWQVDERCSNISKESNFFNMCKELIDFIPELIYSNIHPMPIGIDGSCSEINALKYEQSMLEIVGKSYKLDYIVLGLGSDGHTASLFSNYKSLINDQRYVAMVENAPANISPDRITLTYKTFNAAQKVSVLVMGSSKSSILNFLQSTKCNNPEDFPICKVSNKNLTWFIDNSCL